MMRRGRLPIILSTPEVTTVAGIHKLNIHDKDFVTLTDAPGQHRAHVQLAADSAGLTALAIENRMSRHHSQAGENGEFSD